MGQADFARTWRRSSADERKVRRGVMRRAERARGQDRMAWIDKPGHAVDRACRDRFRVVERREDRFEGSREHRLPGPRWPDEEQVVPAGRGDLERALPGLLPRDVREVDRVRG